MKNSITPNSVKAPQQSKSMDIFYPLLNEYFFNIQDYLVKLPSDSSEKEVNTSGNTETTHPQ